MNRFGRSRLLRFIAATLFTLAQRSSVTLAAPPVYVAVTGAENPFDGADRRCVFSWPAFADLDDDLDLVVGGSDGLFRYFENTGTPLAATFTERTGIENPLDGQDTGNFSTAVLADADGDGDFDLVSGMSTGKFAFFRAPEPGTAAMASAALLSLSILAKRRERRALR